MIEAQGQNAMIEGQTKVGGGSGRPVEHFRSKKYPFDAALLRMTEDTEQLRRNASRLVEQGEEITNETVFQTLLSDANRELASLLQDVRKVQDDTQLDDGQAGRMKKLLLRAVQCAAKQYMLQAELGNLALTDELTGLCNRRGFMAIAERQLKIGHRTGRGILLFFLDIDGMKHINDSFGHGEGDLTLKRTAKALKMTFRDSDVIARLGGDEFAVLAIEASDNSEAAIRARLAEDLKCVNAGETRYGINLSLGAVRINICSNASIGEWMVRADQAMYEQKRRRLNRLSEPGAVLQTI
ncbi:MAG TPA: GGDEF domain-containing protein [Candidatus Acidoferrum sp.]|jgi:diguanylate cyclase (GGDEF)-like protein|nr:GGDEF domain-containing protein [Candidatus Acidoferrum sp.]